MPSPMVAWKLREQWHHRLTGFDKCCCLPFLLGESIRSFFISWKANYFPPSFCVFVPALPPHAFDMLGSLWIPIPTFSRHHLPPPAQNQNNINEVSCVIARMSRLLTLTGMSLLRSFFFFFYWVIVQCVFISLCWHSSYFRCVFQMHVSIWFFLSFSVTDWVFFFFFFFFFFQFCFYWLVFCFCFFLFCFLFLLSAFCFTFYFLLFTFYFLLFTFYFLLFTFYFLLFTFYFYSLLFTFTLYSLLFSLFSFLFSFLPFFLFTLLTVVYYNKL